jgi:hypothetical protein
VSCIPRVLVIVSLMVLTACGGGDERSDGVHRVDTIHGTRPGPLDREDVRRLAGALGIESEVDRIARGFEAEDGVRELYVYRTPSAWYAQFWDSSLLREPPGDRAAICAGSDPPRVCGYGSPPLVVSVGAPSPSEAAAGDAARGVLERAGILDDEWRVRVLEPSRLPVPCHYDFESAYDCNEQLVETRAVVLERRLGAETTALRWGFIVGPGGRVLQATGRLGEPT